MKRLIVAIDGPSAAGKSTAGKTLAARLGYTYLDTGALYRAVAWLAEREGIVDAPGPQIAARLRSTTIRLLGDPGRPRVHVDGCDISDAIRTERISQISSRLSALPEVRDALLSLQRRLGDAGGVVIDGRDIGTVVFPEADVKFFVTASPPTRARRRHQELVGRGVAADESRVLAELMVRDERDAGRAHAPLKAADDAIGIDTTELTPNGVVEKMLAVVQLTLKKP